MTRVSWPVLLSDDQLVGHLRHAEGDQLVLCETLFWADSALRLAAEGLPEVSAVRRSQLVVEQQGRLITFQLTSHRDRWAHGRAAVIFLVEPALALAWQDSLLVAARAPRS